MPTFSSSTLTPFLADATRAVVARDVPDASPQAAETAVAFAVQRIFLMPSFVRAGVLGVTAVLAVFVTLTTGRTFGSLPVRRQIELLDRWASAPVPGVPDWVRLLRSLAVVRIWETNYPLASQAGTAGG